MYVLTVATQQMIIRQTYSIVALHESRAELWQFPPLIKCCLALKYSTCVVMQAITEKTPFTCCVKKTFPAPAALHFVKGFPARDSW